MPDVLPIEINGYCVVWVSVESCATKTWWRELVEPLDTRTNPLSELIWFSVNVAIVDAAETLWNLDSNFAVFSVPSNCPDHLNL